MKKYKDFNLTNYNSYRLQSVCRVACFPETDEDIIELFTAGSPKRILLGSGHNTILSKEYYDEEFVIFSGNYDQIRLVDKEMLLCEAGANMKQLTAFALAHSLSGVEIFYDIPSSLGGAVVMNAGAGGEDMKGLILTVGYFDPATGKIEEKNIDDIGFEYRNSFFQKNPQMIVCRALLQLKTKDAASIKEKMVATEAARHAKQPRDYPNAGSVFKRPPGKFVGPMIDELGLKGYSIGGAQISPKHGGFIVNFNNAKGEDIIQLIHHVQDRVREKFLVDLEIEQRII